MRNILVLAVILFSATVFAKGRGGFSMGGTLGVISTPSQSDMNSLIRLSNENGMGLSISELGSAFEFNGNFSYRFSGSMVAMQFRPSYFTMSEKGTETGGEAFEYGLSGFTLFVNARFYVLESKIFKFFMQSGAGWAFLNGTVKEGNGPDFAMEFSGNAMGILAGLGTEFCFGGSSHCMVIEGNLRYLPIPRVIADSVSNTPNGAESGVTQATAGQEVEANGMDLGTTLSGIMGNIGYTYYF